ncbi:MAG TPA: hypothetical protein VGD26_04020 [Chitinophagaceae bacterium]
MKKLMDIKFDRIRASGAVDETELELVETAFNFPWFQHGFARTMVQVYRSGLLIGFVGGVVLTGIVAVVASLI